MRYLPISQVCNTFSTQTSSMSKVTTNEKKLLFNVQSEKDADSYAQLYDMYLEPIYRFVFFKVATRHDAEELTSDVFLKAWIRLTNSDKQLIRAFRPFIYQIARNTIIDWYRKKSTSNEIPTEFTGNEAATDASTEDRIDTLLSYESLQRAMRGMKTEYQEIIILKYIEELSTAEIAAVLDKKTTAVRVMLHRAMKLLEALVQTPKD